MKTVCACQTGSLLLPYLVKLEKNCTALKFKFPYESSFAPVSIGLSEDPCSFDVFAKSESRIINESSKILPNWSVNSVSLT